MADGCGTRFLHLKISTIKRLTLVLKQGELVYDKDLKKFYYGDGVTVGGLPFGEANFVSAAYNTSTVLTNENFVRVFGSTPVTLTLPSASDQRITIKNTSTEVLTIIPASGTVNGVSDLQIEPLSLPTFAEGNLGGSITLIFQGGQFWVN